MLLGAAPAMAQGYRCSSAQGIHYSDRPCPIQGGTRLGSIGPVPEVPTRSTYLRQGPSTETRAPEYLNYLSAECASLSDGLRTAGARGLSPTTRADLQYDYQRRCAADEAQARRRWSQAQRSDQTERHEQEAQAAADTRRQQMQQQQSSAQCGEMRRIISNKNERLATLSAGEVADLRRFEANFADRCARRLP